MPALYFNIYANGVQEVQYKAHLHSPYRYYKRWVVSNALAHDTENDVIEIILCE